MQENEWKNALRVIDTEFKDNLRSIELYHAFIRKMYPRFIEELNRINKIIMRLKKGISEENGKTRRISQSVHLNARIKGQESARTKTSRKAIINDVFGMEIVTRNKREIEIISEEVEKAFRALERKDAETVRIIRKTIEKDNGYRALHQRVELLGENYETVELPVKRKFDMSEVNVLITPAIEIQYKTFGVKKKTQNDRYHTEDRGATRVQIRRLATENAFCTGITIPRMWSTDENGNICELSKEQILKRMYPFLDKPEVDERGEK